MNIKNEKLINSNGTKTSVKEKIFSLWQETTANVCSVSSAKVKLGYASEEVKYD